MIMKCKKLLSAIIVCSMAIGTFCAAAQADTIAESDYTALAEVVAAANDGDVITLSSEAVVDKEIVIESGKTITIIGGTVKRGDSYKKHLFNVKGILILDGVTVDGNRDNNVEAQNALIYVAANGELSTVNAVLQNNNNVYNSGTVFGGGVYVAANGKFTMNGGKIGGNDANRGGGVHNCGTFTMLNGLIDGNYTRNRAGGVENTGVFTATGSTVSNNTSKGQCGGLWSNKYIELTDCVIKDNTGSQGGGIFVQYDNNLALTLNNCTIINNKASSTYGGGVWCSGQLVMNGGEISGNYAEKQGGALYGKGDFVICGKIADNISAEAGGIYSHKGGALTIKSGSVITGNKATSKQGGGICIGSDCAKLVIEEGVEIAGNYSATVGGGVYLRNNLKEFINNGNIHDNESGIAEAENDICDMREADRCAWTMDTDAGYYMDAEAKKGIMRFLFSVNARGTVAETGIKYVKANDLAAQVGEIASGTDAAFYGDINNIPEETSGVYYAIAYAKVNGSEFWSEPLRCSPNFDVHFIELDK